MAIDTANKRSSAVNPSCPWRGQLPFPDGAVTDSVGDFQHVAFLYAGIVAGALLFSATGTGTATFVGASQADSVLAATGTGTATFVGAATDDAVLSATGTGTATFVGAAFDDGVLSATGTGTATFGGAGGGAAALSATGTGTATFTGASNADGTLSATGTGTASFDPDVRISITGTGTATFTGAAIQVVDSVFSASGRGSAYFAGFGSGAQPTGAGAFNFSTAWQRYWTEERKRKPFVYVDPEEERKKYQRLARKLRMYEEQLLWANLKEQEVIYRKITEIKEQMLTLEWAL